MSCVIGTVFRNFAIISVDKRLSKDSGETVSDTYSKVFKVNQNVLVGFTGSGNAVDILNKMVFLTMMTVQVLKII